MRRFLAALAGGLVLTGAAHAQDAVDDGIGCVYNELIDSYDLVAEIFIYGDLSEEEVAESNQAIATAKSTCAAKYAYSPGQLEIVGELGILASSMDYLSEDLLYSGVSETAISGLMDVYDAFTDDDVDAIFDPDWRSDAAFHAKLKSKVLAAGIPDEADLMEIAFALLEIAAMAEEATLLFMLDEDLQDS